MDKKDKQYHQPVLLKETLEKLAVKPGGLYIDATIGHAGHALAICQQGGRLLGIDLDPHNLSIARERLHLACPAPNLRGLGALWQLSQANFKNIKSTARQNNFSPIDGILFDLGLSQNQQKGKGRGFSFSDTQSLDMRINPTQIKLTAAQIVNSWPEKNLEELLRLTVQERYAAQIAKAIVRRRKEKLFESGADLATFIAKSIPASSRNHPATKLFLALKMTVNEEVENLKTALAGSLSLLKKGGRLLVISFHSTEDRLVKLWFLEKSQKKELQLLGKAQSPTFTEIKKNPLARSAHLRTAQKL